MLNVMLNDLKDLWLFLTAMEPPSILMLGLVAWVIAWALDLPRLPILFVTGAWMLSAWLMSAYRRAHPTEKDTVK